MAKKICLRTRPLRSVQKTTARVKTWHVNFGTGPPGFYFYTTKIFSAYEELYSISVGKEMRSKF